jgi:hypothetical protein
MIGGDRFWNADYQELILRPLFDTIGTHVLQVGSEEAAHDTPRARQKDALALRQSIEWSSCAPLLPKRGDTLDGPGEGVTGAIALPWALRGAGRLSGNATS